MIPERPSGGDRARASTGGTGGSGTGTGTDGSGTRTGTDGSGTRTGTDGSGTAPEAPVTVAMPVTSAAPAVPAASAVAAAEPDAVVPPTAVAATGERLDGPNAGPAVVALGGGHGLFASLSALRQITDRLTAVVTVADDGGSSGRLRRELSVLPPGDLRMALAALCGDDEWGRTWSRVVQHRFQSSGELHGHAVGNLLIAALWQLLGDPVAGLDWVGRLLGAYGRVLPMASVPLDIAARVQGADPARPTELITVRGQAACAKTPGRVRAISLIPPDPPACPEALTAIDEADWVVFGPGSWFTSVLPHLQVPDLAKALVRTPARRIVALNPAPQQGETDDFSPHTHLEVLQAHAPELRIDTVLADRAVVEEAAGEPGSERAALEKAAEALGGRLVLADVACDDGTPRHDKPRLATALAEIFAGRGPTAADRL